MSQALRDQHMVRFGRTDNSVTKTCFFGKKREALHVANSISFLLWTEHSFKPGECDDIHRVERDGYWIEYKLKH